MSVTVAALKATIGADDSNFQAGVKRTGEGIQVMVTGFDALDKAVAGLENTSKTLGEGLKAVAAEFAATSAESAKMRDAFLATEQENLKLKESLNQLTAENAKLSQQLTNATKKTVDFRGEVQALSGYAMGAGAALSAGLTAPIAALAVGSVQAGTKMDSLTRALDATSHSSQETARQMRDLREVAKLPGLGFEEAVQGSVRLQAAGLSADEAKQALMGFGNALAQVGKGKASLEIVGDELTRLASRSRVSAREIMEISKQVPQLRGILQKAFKTSDSMELEEMGVTSKKFIQVVTTELLKIDKVTGGAANSFENLQDSVAISLSTIGKDLLTVVVPALNTTSAAVEYSTQIWSQLPTPIKAAYGLLGGSLAVIGPVVLITGTLGMAITSTVKAYESWIAIQPLLAANLTASTTAVGGFTGSILTSTVAVTSWRGAMLLAVPTLTALVAGWTIGTAINDAFIGSLDRLAQKTEDDTAAHVKSIPYLEKAIAARKELQKLDAIIAATGDQSLKTSARYKEVAGQAKFLAEEYRKAAETMHKEFNSEAEKSAMELKGVLEKEVTGYREAVEKAQKELDKLKAPDLVAKLRVDYPDMTKAELENLANVQKQIDAQKTLEAAQKKAQDAALSRASDFRKQIEDARKEIATLQAVNNLQRVRANAPAGTSEAQIHQLASLKDQIDALNKAKAARDAEIAKVNDLAAKMGGLSMGMSTAAAKTQMLTEAAQRVTRTAPAGGGGLDLGRRAPGQWDAAKLGPLNGPQWHGLPGMPFLPPVGPVTQYTAAVEKLTPAVKVVTAAHVDMVSSIQKSAAALAAEVGADHASKLVDSTANLRKELALMQATTDKNRISLELTGKTYDSLSAATRKLIDQNVTLTEAVKRQQEIKTVTDAWKEAKNSWQASSQATDEQRLSFELLKKSFASLSPTMQGQIKDIAQWKASQDAARKTAEDTKRFNDALNSAMVDAREKFTGATAATDAQRMALGFFKDKLKDVPKDITDFAEVMSFLANVLGLNTKGAQETADAIAEMNKQLANTAETKKFIDGLNTAVSDSRQQFFEASAATDEQRIALQLLREQLKTLPPEVNNVDDALSMVGETLGYLGVDLADAIKRIQDFNAKVKAIDAAKKLADETQKSLDAMKKAVDNFEGDTSKRLEAARIRIAGGDGRTSAESAWLDYLAKNDLLAKALAADTAKAAQEFARFKELFKVEHQADVIEKLSKAVSDVDEKLREANAGFNDGKTKVSDYEKVMAQLGITTEDLDSTIDGMIRHIVEAQKQLEKLAENQALLKKLADGMQSTFENVFEDLFKNGFQNFFSNVINGFRDLLNKMAAEYLSSQLVKLITNAIGGLFSAGAAGAGGGGGNTQGLGDFNFGDGGGVSVASATVQKATYQDASVYVRPDSVRGGGGGSSAGNRNGHTTVLHVTQNFHVTTQDAESFRRSKTQIMHDGVRSLDRIKQRKG